MSKRVWNHAGVLLAILTLAVAFLWTFGVIEYERAVLALLAMIVFGLIYIGTQCLGICDELRWRNLNIGKKR